MPQKEYVSEEERQELLREIEARKAETEGAINRMELIQDVIVYKKVLPKEGISDPLLEMCSTEGFWPYLTDSFFDRYSKGEELEGEALTRALEKYVSDLGDLMIGISDYNLEQIRVIEGRNKEIASELEIIIQQSEDLKNEVRNKPEEELTALSIEVANLQTSGMELKEEGERNNKILDDFYQRFQLYDEQEESEN